MESGGCCWLLVMLGLAWSSGTCGDWLVECSSISALAWVHCWILSYGRSRGALVACFGLSNLFAVEGSLAAQAFLNTTWHRSLASFHAGGAPPRRPPEAWRDLVRATLPVHGLTLLVVATLHHTGASILDSEHVSPHDDLLHLSVPRFCGTLTAFRLLVDLVFYATHRAQHAWSRLYVAFHARHHRHRVTGLDTNLQFTATDLFLEGSLPSLVAGATLGALGVRASVLEQSLCLLCVQWYQIGSHNSKDVGTVTALPPIGPLYNHPRLKPWRPPPLRDHRHVRFHAAHHRRLRGNYGISPWLDWLLGTLVT